MSHTFETLPVQSIRTDDGTQSRQEISMETVTEYAEAIAEGAEFPPIVVFTDGETHWVADGFHRLAAAKQAGKDTIKAEVHQGDVRAARLHSVGANAAHGLKRSNIDKRRAVQMMLADAEWVGWSDREIARRCRVDHKFVAKVKLTGDIPSDNARTYTTKHGTTSKMDTSNLRSKPAADPDKPASAAPPSANHEPAAPADNAEPEQPSAGNQDADTAPDPTSTDAKPALSPEEADLQERERKARKGLNDLTVIGLKDEVVALRLLLQDQEEKIHDLTMKVAALEEVKADFEEGDYGKKISQLRERVALAKMQHKDSMINEKRMQYRMKLAQKAQKEAEEKLAAAGLT